MNRPAPLLYRARPPNVASPRPSMYPLRLRAAMETINKDKESLARVVVLISGRGSNLARLITEAKSYRVVRVISDREDAPGLNYAHKHEIETRCFPRERYESRAAQREAILHATEEAQPDLVALAGFMQIVPASFVECFSGRLVNIHPALLPKYPGLDTHTRVLHDGASEHGCTVHFVDAGVDTGPVIAQWRCAVRSDDTAAVLAERVLAGEHLLYPWVMNALGRGEIALVDGRVSVEPSCRERASQVGITFAPSTPL